MGALIGHLLGHPEPPAIPFIELHNAGLEKGKRYCIEFMYKPAGEKEIIEKFTASVIEIEYNGKVQFFLGERNGVTSYRRLFPHSKIRAQEISFAESRPEKPKPQQWTVPQFRIHIDAEKFIRAHQINPPWYWTLSEIIESACGYDRFMRRNFTFHFEYQVPMERMRSIGGDIPESNSCVELREGKPIRKPFEFLGKLWVCTGSHHRDLTECYQAEAWTLIPHTAWNGPTYTYDALCEEWKSGNLPRVCMAGLAVRHGRKKYIFEEMAVFTPRSDAKTEPIPAEQPKRRKKSNDRQFDLFGFKEAA